MPLLALALLTEFYLLAGNKSDCRKEGTEGPVVKE